MKSECWVRREKMMFTAEKGSILSQSDLNKKKKKTKKRGIILHKRGEKLRVLDVWENTFRILYSHWEFEN